MEVPSPASPYPPLSAIPIVANFWHEYLSPGLLFSVLSAGLGVWLVFLLHRPRSPRVHIAFVAAALFPALVGMFSGSLAMIEFLDLVGNGGGGPARPQMLASDIGSFILYLFYGSILTFVFLICGIGLLLFRSREKTESPG
jgi:hypothetical protein